MERKNILIAGVVTVAFILIIQLFNLQILNEEYKITAENNAYKYITRYPVRGLILDRNNNGVVFSSICGQETERSYVKPIEEGRVTPDYKLTREEEQALRQAMKR